MSKTRHIYIPFLFAALLASTVSSCSDDYMPGDPGSGLGSGITFGASIEEDRGVDTRGLTRGNPGLDSIYVAYNPWNQDFYIQLNTETATGEPETEYGVYRVPSAYEGRLDAVDEQNTLNWKNLDRTHTFYAWTIPWMETNPEALSDEPEGADDTGDTGSETPELYTPSDRTVPVPFYNSSEQYGFDLNKNNAVYEGFIGAKSGSYTYSEHGKYVDLTFHHLVSKIKIESLILIQPDGSVQKDLQADMTFIGMPIEATFYPHPVPNDPSGAPEGWRPYVGKPYVESPDTGVTYYINNRANSQDVFYVCPEVDFSKIDYQIKINTQGYEKLKTYYGTFDDVVFERTPGWGYDIGPDEKGDTIDRKILHAGEEMRLNIVLIPGVGPGLKVIIQKWSTDKPVESQYHSHPGFYSDAELQELMDMMYDINQSTYENPPEELDLLFEMYGYTKDGKKYFPLYENVTPKKGTSTSNIFPVPPGYIIDGMGHTVTLKTNEGDYWQEGRSKYFNVGGQCRDIYFSDENGENTIYIDPDGYIWITGADGQLERTENFIPYPTPEGYRGFDISCKSGKIRPTTYFNDRLGS
ncbi:MAG: hypothetical protein J1F07_03980 [Muribaculaceae bacterium]|nr:hypothetical protein [Muribaculaceae bacterium]